jgi:hypothetical protein
VSQVAALATLGEVRRLMPFHHDPGHTDDEIDAMTAAIASQAPSLEVVPGREGRHVDVAA